MKKILFACTIIMLSSSFLVTPEEIQANIKKGQFYLGTTKLSPVWLLSESMGVLGIPDQVGNGYNNTYTFDQDGIVIFENKFGGSASGKIKEMQFYLTKGDSDGVAPKNAFKGKFFVEKTEITSSLDMNTLRNKLSDWNAVNGYRPHSLKLTYEQLFLFCQFSEDEKTLEKISVGLKVAN